MSMLTRYYVVPIDFVFYKYRIAIETIWVQRFRLIEEVGSFKTFTCIANKNPKIYKIIDGAIGWIFFDDCGACIIMKEIEDGWSPNGNTVLSEILYRTRKHHEIIKIDNNKFLRNLVEIANASIYKRNLTNEERSFLSTKIHYVFGFFLYTHDTPLTREENAWLKILSEPSVIDLDDMFLEEEELSKFPVDVLFKQAKSSVLNSICDSDICNWAETYITWATIVSKIGGHIDNFKKSEEIIVSLEARLQLVWNGCYNKSLVIDKIIDKKTVVEWISDLYWSFSRTLDDSKSVLNVIQSSRIDALFQKMLETSKLAGEINRLEQKISLIEKFLKEIKEAKRRKFAFTIELILFVVALTQAIPIFFKTPVFENELIGEVAILAIFVSGVIAMIAKK